MNAQEPRRKVKHAFIFDMDGVLIDSERGWQAREPDIMRAHFGEAAVARLGTTVGLSLDAVCDRARALGAEFAAEALHRDYDAAARMVYAAAALMPALDRLVIFLKERDFALGLVSNSKRAWIDCVLSRLPFRDRLECVMSAAEQPGLRPKPCPDVYVAAMKTLGIAPARTIVLEDSNSGIRAAKASGAHTIGFRAHLLPGYQQAGADDYADSAEAVMEVVTRRLARDDADPVPSAQP